MAATVYDAVMLFGDSITQGAWEFNGIGARLAHLYARQFDVLNRGYSGYNTEWALPIFEKILAKQHEQKHVPRVRLLTIWFGANDACLEQSPQHVALPRYSENLRTMIHMVKSEDSPYYSPETKLLLISAPPVNTYQRGGILAQRDPPIQLDRSFEVTREYAREVVRVGEKEGVPVVDVWTRLWEGAGQDEQALEKYLYDGLHLNEAGYAITYDAILETIRTAYPDFPTVHDAMNYAVPEWRFFLDHSVEDLKGILANQGRK